MLARVLFWVSASGVAWVYGGYPLVLAVAGRLFTRPRVRAAITPSVSVIVVAHNEADTIARKVANVRTSAYPSDRIELVVASDGSTDDTAGESRRAGADLVLDLPRGGKMTAINHAAAAASGEILVFTDADSTFEPGTLATLVANFADPHVGAVAGSVVRGARDGIGAGEGLYWRYEQWIKRLEDRLGSAVSATGQLYAIRRELFQPSPVRDGTDDFLVSTQVVLAGYRLAFDPEATVVTDPPDTSRSELRRKVRLMNRGLRAAFSLGRFLVPWRGGFYAIQVVSHKILRRYVPFLLVLMLATSAWLVATGHTAWWFLLGPQLAFYALAALAWLAGARPWGRHKLLAVPYYFCLANVAAGIAVLSVHRGRRFVVWEPERPRGAETDLAVTSARAVARPPSKGTTHEPGVPRSTS